MSRTRLSILAVALWAYAAPVSAQSGLAFLEIGPDAAGMALGDAGAAVVSGAYAAERNPAALADGAGTEMALTHHVWIADVRTYSGAARFDAAGGGLGVYVRATGSGDLEARDGPGDPDGLFDAQFLAAGLAYGRALGPVELGAAAKYLSERIFGVSANGVAFDLGLRVRPVDGLSVAAVYQHAGSMEALDQRETALPRTIRGAVAAYPFRALAMLDGTVLAEAFVTVEVSRNLEAKVSQVHYGLSGHVLETVQARLGYVTNSELRGFSFGAGLAVSGFQVDYALLPFEQGWGGPGHIFTLGYSL